MDRLEFLKKFTTFNEWFKIVENIVLSEEFQKRKKFKHHGEVTVFDHSCLVSIKSYILAKKLGADTKVAALAGLLHDFYPKAWIYNEELDELDPSYSSDLNIKKPFFKQHGFVHGKEASINYQKFYPEIVDKKITDAIKRHMFPLNIVPPRYKEGWIITIIDKQCSISDVVKIKNIHLKVLKWIFRKN